MEFISNKLVKNIDDTLWKKFTNKCLQEKILVGLYLSKIIELDLQGFSIKAIKRLMNTRYKYYYQYDIGGSVGKNETTILDEIEKFLNIKIERQYSIDNYFVDGYDIINNVIFEIDGKFHKKELDKIREIKIKEKINCKILRINEKDFLNHKLYILDGINKVWREQIKC